MAIICREDDNQSKIKIFTNVKSVNKKSGFVEMDAESVGAIKNPEVKQENDVMIYDGTNWVAGRLNNTANAVFDSNTHTVTFLGSRLETTQFADTQDYEDIITGE